MEENSDPAFGDRKPSQETGAITNPRIKASSAGAPRSLSSCFCLPYLCVHGSYTVRIRGNPVRLTDFTESFCAGNEHWMGNPFAVFHSHTHSCYEHSMLESFKALGHLGFQLPVALCVPPESRIPFGDGYSVRLCKASIS